MKFLKQPHYAVVDEMVDLLREKGLLLLFAVLHNGWNMALFDAPRRVIFIARDERG